MAFNFDFDFLAELPDLVPKLNPTPDASPFSSTRFTPPSTPVFPSFDSPTFSPSKAPERVGDVTKSLEKTILSLADVTTLCKLSLGYITQAIQKVSLAMDKPPLYDQTDADAFEVVKTKFEGIKTQGSELTAIWEEVIKDIQTASKSLNSARSVHQKFDSAVEGIQSEAHETMNAVRFSSTENLTILPMSTVTDPV